LKLLLDMCVPVGIVSDLAAAGHDVVHVRDLDPRATDDWIVEWARRHDRVAVTIDLDFGDIMSHVKEASPSVVLMRLRHPTPANVVDRLSIALSDHFEALESGAIVIVEDSRIRVRRLPIHAR
jgi:predicted nuclease of predicted toxin-antitoxin system